MASNSSPSAVLKGRVRYSRFHSAIRQIAIWRIVFLLILVLYEFAGQESSQVLFPFGSLRQLDLDVSQQKVDKDRWFTYQQFRWMLDVHASLGMMPAPFRWLFHPRLLGLVTAVGIEVLRLRPNHWRICSVVFTIVYCLQFFVRSTSFTNHNYLFALLLVLTTISGGGQLSGRIVKEAISQNNNNNIAKQQIGACEAAIVAIRAQFAVVYGFASLWKLHRDWFNGQICRQIFLGMEERTKVIPWSYLDKEYPMTFPLLAFSGFMLDFGMFCVLTFGRPTFKSRNAFLAFTLLFHVFTTIAMGNLIGYSFPATCIAGLVVFLPLERHRNVDDEDEYDGRECYDLSLVQWVREYVLNMTKYEDDSQIDYCAKKKKNDDYTANGVDKQCITRPLPSRWNRNFVLGWVIWQLAFPLRMIFVSGGNFPINRLGYRYSWTMMLHSVEAGIVREQKDADNNGPMALLLSYMTPTCHHQPVEEGDRLQQLTEYLHVPREVYFGADSANAMSDSRTVPLYTILDQREYAMMEVFPTHLLAGIAHGVGGFIDNVMGHGACMQKFPAARQKYMGVHVSYFGRLNSRGPFSRLIDPTVDMAAAQRISVKLPYYQTVLNSMFDRRRHEFVLDGVASLRAVAADEEANLRRLFPNQKVSIIADRVACLQRMPLWLRPMNQRYVLVALRVPQGYQLRLSVMTNQSSDPNSDGSGEQQQSSPEYEYHTAALGYHPLPFQTMAAEIGIESQGTISKESCGETTGEDILFAIIEDDSPVARPTSKSF